MIDKISIRAYAKINLGLDVVGRLDNGYHQVKMIMQAVDIYDKLDFIKVAGGIGITSNFNRLPLNRNNLVYKAVELMQENYHISQGVRVHLTKNIPVAAGMAGGSGDAAATMKAMNILFDLKATTQELMELGVKIGADVPYCLLGGTALAEGIGEILTPLQEPPACHLVIVKPGISVSTKYVYEHLDSSEIVEHPDIDGMLGAIGNQDLDGIIRRMGNVLENVTIPAHPVIAQIKERMLSLGAMNSLMSGSGPTVFGVFKEYDQAKMAWEQLKKEGIGKQVFLTGFAPR